MKQFLMLFLSFCFSFGLLAQETNDTLFTKGIKSFNQKDYKTSVQIFNELLKVDSLNAVLHYNLGTSYLHLQKTGLSIYHLEKSLKLRPDYEPARINLNFAEKLKTEVTKGNLPIPQQQMLYSVFHFMNPNSWAYIAICTMLLAVILLVAFKLNGNAVGKKILFSIGIFALILSVSSYYISRNQSNYLMTHHYAVLKEDAVSLMEEPRNISKIITTLSEGSKCFIKEETNHWIKIQLQNDTIGWVEKSNVLTY